MVPPPLKVLSCTAASVETVQICVYCGLPFSTSALFLCDTYTCKYILTQKMDMNMGGQFVCHLLDQTFLEASITAWSEKAFLFRLFII